MLIKRDDRPVIHALLALSLAVFLNVPVSPQTPTAQEISKHTTYNEGWQMISWLLGWDSNDTIAVFTGIVGLIAYFQWHHSRVTERAYVRLSHVSEKRDALQWLRGSYGKGDICLEARNCGRTPARISAIWLVCRYLPEGREFPAEFSYNDTNLAKGRVHAFVMPNDAIYRTVEVDLSPEEYGDIVNGPGKLVVYGYVDYVDQFGVHHRGGYARQYIREAKTHNNMGFPDTAVRLNYDERRARGVGLDWNQ